ncbi:hypothetical protein RJT34_12694 [Clitoria ternatea]|uniref:Uncharacterized protein n=1 Tax=Clitoria ternatea TaxID=43366 RepID=A0AAN9PL01_CLITE
MAPTKQKRVAAACDILKEFGISKVRVKKAIDDLLKVYDDNWEFIEDDNYRVLIDALLEGKVEKDKLYEMMVGGFVQEVKSQKEAQECDDPLIFDIEKKRSRPKRKKGKVESPAKKLKTSPMIEKDEVGLSSGSQTPEDHDKHFVKRKNARNKKQILVHEGSMYHGNRSCSWPAENSLRGLDGLSPSEDCETLKKKSRADNNQKHHRDLLSYHMHGKKLPFSEFSFGKKQLSDQTLTDNILDFYHNDHLHFPSGEAYDYNQPRDEMPLKLMYPASHTGNFDVKENESRLLQIDHSNALEKGSHVSSSTSQCDIASSSNREVKVSLIYNTSQSDSQVPSLDAVLKNVEEKYKLYKTLDSDFSVTKLMRDVCDCFLAMASVDKALEINNTSLSKESDGTGNSGNNFWDNLISLNGLISFQNLVKIGPQIPNLVALSGLEGLHYISGFRIPDVVLTQSCRQRRIEALDVREFSTSNTSIVASSEKHCCFSAVKCFYIDDITREEEKEKISLVNSFCAEQFPTFNYIKHNIIYDKANVKFALARISEVQCCSHCSGDCLAISLPCECACMSGGEFAYTQEGLLKEKFLEECISLVKDLKEQNFYCKRCPVEMSKNKQKVEHCKGHLLRKFIKECWSKCGCNKSCGNRVVQRGISVKLQVFWTPEGKGWGIQTLEDLPKGAFVCEYVGEVVTNMELYERIVQSRDEKKHKYSVALDADWCSEDIMNDEEALCLDATLYGNVARFINHRCGDASLIEIPIEVETPNHHYYHLALFTQRKVSAMEELTWDYGVDFNDQDHHGNAFTCLCNSPLCRDQRPKI